MMPGTGRRLRLMADWTVGLMFGRASAELGALGHPPALAAHADPPFEAGEASAPGAGPAEG
jgi:NADH dehydrogenase